MITSVSNLRRKNMEKKPGFKARLFVIDPDMAYFYKLYFQKDKFP